MYVQHISVRNLRSIAFTEVDFLPAPPAGGGLITLLLGGNGAGKTSILRAIALACLGPSLAESGFLPYRLVSNRLRSSSDKPALAELTARVALTAQDAHKEFAAGTVLALTCAIERWGTGVQRRERIGKSSAHIAGAAATDAPTDAGERYRQALFQGDLSHYLVFGYGATRRIEAASSVDMSARSKSRAPRYQRVAGLFEEGVTLVPLSFWLPAYQARNPGRAKQVATLINKLLPEGCSFLPKPQETENGTDFLFRINGTSVPFGALSDGYRAYIGWVADLMYHLTLGAASGHRLDETQGIVLVDEIDLHLHPQWQRNVLPMLASALPFMQFVVTSHSPLVAASLPRQQVRVLQAHDDGTSVDALNESIKGRSVDQILRSPYFGLDSTRSVDTEQRLRSLTDKVRGGDVQASLAYMRELSGASADV